MDIEKLNKKELLKLKDDIDNQIKVIDENIINKKKIGEKSKISDLSKGDKIYCINFSGDNVYHKDYVSISFNEINESQSIYYGYVKFSTEHKTKPMGCSSVLSKESFDNHYFLSDFVSSMYFFTLKPETWRNDLNSELERFIISKETNFIKELDKFKTKITKLIESNQSDDLTE